MQSGVSTNAIDASTHFGAAIQILSASGPVLPSTDFIKAVGGAAGIVLTLTGHSFPTGKPTSPLVLFQVHQAVRIDAGAGEVTFIDSSGALFNGASTYDLVNQYQWATFIWDGSNWTVIGN